MFLNYINAFRAVAIFFIVATHSVLVFSWDTSLVQKKILDIVIGSGTVFFLFIAGYLFQHLSSKFDTKKYYASKLQNILLPYLIISLPSIIYYVFISPRNWDANFVAQPEWLQVFYYYWWGLHLYNMWFIPVIALFYLLGPILIKGDKSNILYCLLPLFIFISVLVPRSLFTTDNFLHFFSIYVLGMLASKYKSKINPILAKNNMIITLIVSFLCLSSIEYFAPNFTPEMIKYVQKLVQLLVILSLLIKYEKHMKSKWIDIVANASFGVYFVHAYLLLVIKFVSKYMNEHFLSNGLRYIPGNLFIHLLITSITLVLSIIIVMMIKRALGNSSYLLIGHIKTNAVNYNKKLI